MSPHFPPRADHPHDIELLIEGFASVVEGRTALYVSSPLTTGPRASEWHHRNGGRAADEQAPASDDFRRDVIEPNRTEAAKFVGNLRESSRRVVVDPTALKDLPGWTQADYRVFWGRVIERYAEAVVFRDGWMHSSGCAYEFFIAWSSAVRLLREDLAPLSLEQGRSLIAQAVEESRERGVSSQFLQQVQRALHSPVSGEEAG